MVFQGIALVCVTHHPAQSVTNHAGSHRCGWPRADSPQPPTMPSPPFPSLLRHYHHGQGEGWGM